ncbi:hypothetical protein OCD69_09820 [Bacillus paranthracis]|uniref:hypothetical protein n=1 Tax=Bacillus paranthracis TaxID=2026186 RepID=UPI0021D30D28|nr:hypothetical protein [Bacillus paranthracis]MCU4904571.1 hypothetical protein [Bacillus paranthracis]
MRRNIFDFGNVINKEAEREFVKLCQGIDISDRKLLVLKLLENSGLSHIEVSFPKMKEFGSCRGNLKNNPTNIVKLQLTKVDLRKEAYQIKTVLHEFFHAKLHGLDNDYAQMGRDNWVLMEEVATETAAHYMAELVGIPEEMGYSYSKFIIQVLPKLKQLKEFEDCTTFKEFGYKFLKYRFSKNKKSGKWQSLFDEYSQVDLDIIQYAQQYRNEVITYKAEIIKIIFDQINYADKYTNKAAYLNVIEESIDIGWTNNDIKEQGFHQSLCVIMNRIGVK